MLFKLTYLPLFTLGWFSIYTQHTAGKSWVVKSLMNHTYAVKIRVLETRVSFALSLFTAEHLKKKLLTRMLIGSRM